MNLPIIAKSEPDQERTTGKGNNISLHLSGNDDAMIAGVDGTVFEDLQSPDIDLHQELRMNLNKDKTVLQISGKLSGDAFPNAESFIEDPAGNRVMLQTFKTKWGPQNGPTVALWGDSQRPMGDFIININLNKDGNFTSVSYPLQNDKKVSIDENNKLECEDN